MLLGFWRHLLLITYLTQSQFNPGVWEGDIDGLIEHMDATNPKVLNGEILTSLFWRLLGSFNKMAAETGPLVGDPFFVFTFYFFPAFWSADVFPVSICRISMRAGYAAFGNCLSLLYPARTMFLRSICVMLLQNAGSRHRTSSQSSLLMKVLRQIL